MVSPRCEAQFVIAHFVVIWILQLGSHCLCVTHSHFQVTSPHCLISSSCKQSSKGHFMKACNDSDLLTLTPYFYSFYHLCRTHLNLYPWMKCKGGQVRVEQQVFSIINIFQGIMIIIMRSCASQSPLLPVTLRDFPVRNCTVEKCNKVFKAN